MDGDNKVIKILWAVFLIPFIIGVGLMGESESKTTYSVGSYWVSKDYGHVYDTYSGEIVDKIEEDERCEIDGDTIVVIRRNQVMWGIGLVLAVLFGFGVAALLWDVVQTLWLGWNK